MAGLRWLLPPKVPKDGVMSLGDHLRELRYRVTFSAVVIVIGMVCCAFFYNQLLDFMLEPYRQAMAILKNTNANLDPSMAMSGVAEPLFVWLKLFGIGGIVITAPVWLYQVWAYIAPALVAKEKKYAFAFLAVSLPLFFAGVALGYYVLPTAVAIMLSFTPTAVPVQNLIFVDQFLGLMIQLMLVFGIGFLLPVVVVALNLVGVVSGKTLAKARPAMVFGCFVFGAAATPGGDPISMLALAVPMMVLFFIAEGVCHMNDKRRIRKLKAQGLYVEPVEVS